MAGATDSILDELLPLKLTYSGISGSDRLRDSVASLYSGLTRDNVMITHGAIGENSLVYQALGEPGDRIVAAINPNNPTGSLMSRDDLIQLAEIASNSGAYVLSDEVYRGTDQTGDGSTTSIADIYDRGISTGSMSKAFSLAGLRLGWVAGPADVMSAVSIHRDYNTISVSMIDDLFASIALDVKDSILERSRAIVRRNRAILDDWVATQPAIDYVKPKSGTTAMLRYEADIPSRTLCEQILKEAGVLLTPGEAFGSANLFADYSSNPRVGLQARPGEGAKPLPPDATICP